jgi:hypothetical protein
MLEKYKQRGRDALTEYLVVKKRLGAWDGITRDAKAKALEAARKRYEAEVEEIKAEAAAEIEAEREAFEAAAEKQRLAEWSDMRGTLGEAGAALVMMEKIKGLSLPELQELYQDADDWGKTIIGKLAPEPQPTEGGQLDMAAVQAYEAIADAETRRLEGGAELRSRGRDLENAERQLDEVDPLGHAKAQGDALELDMDGYFEVRDITHADHTKADDFISSALAED